MSEIKKEFKRLKMEEVFEHPQNVRIHTKRNLTVLKNSLSQWGQYRPILVQKSTNYIIAGNGLYQAAKSLGWEEIDCNLIDVDDDQAKSILIMDNRSNELSENDEKNLLDMLQNMEKDMLDLTGYDDHELDKMLQFHEGNMFNDDNNGKKEKKKKDDNLSKVPVSADDQISFVLMGYAFVLADPEQIREIKDLMDKFMDKNIEVKCETTFVMWKAIRDVIAEAVNDGQCKKDENQDFEIETDR